AALRHVAQKRHPVRELAAVYDRHELQIELELMSILAPRGGLGRERLPRENVMQERIENRVMPLDDAEGHRRLADDFLALASVDVAEAVVDEGDARAERLDRGREDGDPLPRHAHRAA